MGLARVLSTPQEEEEVEGESAIRRNAPWKGGTEAIADSERVTGVGDVMLIFGQSS